MKRLHQSRSVFCVAATLLTACGGWQSPSTAVSLIPVTGSTSSANKASNLSHEPTLFVANNSSNTTNVVIYPADVPSPEPIGTITDGVCCPRGLAVDQYGTLYVQNGNNTITEYRDGKTIATKTLVEPGSSAGESIAVGKDGTVYAGGEGVVEFAAGSTTPTKLLRVNNVVGLAVDRQNDLYVAQQPCNFPVCFNGRVLEFKPGSTHHKNLHLDLGYTTGLSMDADDDLLVGQSTCCFTGIAVFKPGSSEPSRNISTQATGVAYMFALDRNEKNLYVSHGAPHVDVYDYATGVLEWSVTNGLSFTTGVAVRPALRP